MALVLTQGFGASTNASDLYNGGEFIANNAQPQTIGTGGTFGDNYWNCAGANNGGGGTFLLPAAISTFYFGFRFAHTYVAAQAYPFNYYFNDNNGSEQIHVSINGAGQVFLFRGGTQLATSASGVVAINNTFHYMEIGGVINSSTGSITVKIDGVSVLTYTGNTANTSATSSIQQIGFVMLGQSGNASANVSKIQHLYVCDNTGSVNNTFLGDVRIRTLFPTGAGGSTQFTPTGASTNWQVAATTPPATATKYNQDSTVNDQDLFTAAPLATTVAVVGVTVKAYTGKTTAGSRTLSPILKSGTTQVAGTAIPVTPTPAYAKQVCNLDPNTGTAWTAAGVNAIQFGYMIVS